MTQPPNPFDKDYPNNQPQQPYPSYGQTPHENVPPANGGYAAYPPAANQNVLNQGIAAGPWRRLGAYVIDAVILTFILGTIGAAVSMSSITPGMSAEEIGNLVAQPFPFFNEITTLVIFLYFTFLQTTNFSTIGKRAIGIRVTTMDLQPISLGTSALRSAWLLLPLIPALGGLLSFIFGIVIFVMLFNGDQTQGLNDKLAKTRGVLRSATNY